MCCHGNCHMTHHAAVQHTIRNRFPAVVLGVEGLADHVDVCLLMHLLWREQAKLQVATGRGGRCLWVRSACIRRSMGDVCMGDVWRCMGGVHGGCVWRSMCEMCRGDVCTTQGSLLSLKTHRPTISPNYRCRRRVGLHKYSMQGWKSLLHFLGHVCLSVLFLHPSTVVFCRVSCRLRRLQQRCIVAAVAGIK